MDGKLDMGKVGRPPCEGVGRNDYGDWADVGFVKGRPPCEGVGRNPHAWYPHCPAFVALHVRAWVEILLSHILLPSKETVALHVRAWVEIDYTAIGTQEYQVALHVRAWVEMPWVSSCSVG